MGFSLPQLEGTQVISAHPSLARASHMTLPSCKVVGKHRGATGICVSIYFFATPPEVAVMPGSRGIQRAQEMCLTRHRVWRWASHSGSLT